MTDEREMKERAEKFIDLNPKIWDTIGRMAAFAVAECDEFTRAFSRAMEADERSSWEPNEIENIVKELVTTAKERSDALDKVTAERDAAIEECCKDVCQICRDGKVGPAIYGPIKHDPIDGWIHYLAPDYTEFAVCSAAAIRSRVAAKGEE